jgi:endonuclease/exonuclease/phosphatase family metal-dependent hydrolase
VSNSLTIRVDGKGDAAKVGELNKGEEATLIGKKGRYYHIRLDSGLEGYVAKSHSKIIPTKETLSIVTWNLEGPAGLDNKDFKGFAEFIEGVDVLVLEETLGEDQTKDAISRTLLPNLNIAVSDFAKDTNENPYTKQELAIITPHALGNIIEVDPYENDDTEAMRAKDINFEVPNWIPEAQRKSKGSRGWYWVDIPSLKLSIAAVHLKSSRGKTGKEDEKNSHKREAVAAGLVEAIKTDSKARPNWSYIVAGDFNIAPADKVKVGTDLHISCSKSSCSGYDQTHAIFGGGLVEGVIMRNLVEGLSASYAKGNFAQSPIDNIYAFGPIFDQATKLTAEKGEHFGSDHYALKVSLEY